jgi:hypothetical protein
MSDEEKVYRVEIPLHFYYETYFDPEATPEHRLKLSKTTHAATACERLFWVVKQLGISAGHSGYAYTQSDLYEALQTIGEVGIALAVAANEEAEYLEHTAARYKKEAEGEGSARRRSSANGGEE